MKILMLIKHVLFGETSDEVQHIEFNARKTEQLPFFNEWSKQINSF